MARQVYTYIIVGIGLMMLLALAGQLPDNLGPILNFFLGSTGLDFTDITSGQFFVIIAGIFGGLGFTGIAVGFLLNRNVESFLIFGLVSGIFTIFYPIWFGVIKLAQSYNDFAGTLLLIILIPYTIGFGIAIVNYWRGAD